MTREEITALAREAGFIEMGGQHGALRRFALLVQAREREACALAAEPELQTCNCRWDGAVQVAECGLHNAHVEAINEWAARAKTAEAKLSAEPERVPLTEEQVATVMSSFYSDVDHAEMMFAADLEKCRAVERAHGIGCGK